MEACINGKYRVVEEKSLLLLLPCCLLEEWPLRRGAVGVTRKINTRIMIFVTAMFDGDERRKISREVVMEILGNILLCLGICGWKRLCGVRSLLA